MREPTAHRDDPSTSWDAAHSAKDLARKHRALVHGALEKLGVASSERIAAFLKLTPLQVMKRITELLQDNCIQVFDEEGITASGRRCRRYRIPEKQ